MSCRIDLHRRAADAIEKRPGADAEEVARHRDEGGQRSEAAHFYAEAAIAAGKRGDSAGVVRCATRALELGATEGVRFDLYFWLADALRFLGRRKEQAEALEQALEHRRGALDEARVRIEQVSALSRAGKTDEAVQMAGAAREVAETAGDPETLALACVRAAQAYVFAGRFDDAGASLAEASAIAPVDSPAVGARIAEIGALLATTIGDVGKARDGFAEAVRVHRGAGDVRRASVNEQNLADTYNRLGAYTEAEAALGRALAGCRDVGNRIGEGYACVNLGYACTMQGRGDEALEWLGRAEEHAKRSEDLRLSLFVHVYRARALVVAGDLDRAAVEARAAIAGAGAASRGAVAALGESALARALLGAGRGVEAEQASGRAMELRNRAGGLEEDDAEVFLVRADSLEACGQAKEAEVVRAQGRARVQELAARIEDPEWRQRFLSDVPAHRALLEGD